MSKKLQNKRALNPVKHGVTAGILPHEGRVWRQHLAAVRDALQPADAVEAALVERIAVTLWRLRRVAIWETSLLDDARARLHRAAWYAARPIIKTVLRFVGDAGAGELDAPAYLTAEQARIATLERALAALDDEAEWTALDVGDDAATIGETLIGALDEQEKATLAARWEIAPEEIAEVELTAEDLPDLLELLGIERARTALEAALRSARQTVALVEEVLALIHRMAAEAEERARPDFDELAKLQRYEAHLERMLYRALHELEALQARRRGEAAPLGRIAVYGADEPPLPALDG
jgi:hypothetical protein